MIQMVNIGAIYRRIDGYVVVFNDQCLRSKN